MSAIIGPYIVTWRWLRGQRPGPDSFTYHRRSMLSALLIVVAFSLPVELLLVELLVPWLWLRIVVAALAVITTLWVVGLVLGIRMLPHVVGPAALVLRYGVVVEATIPHASIASIEAAPQPSATPEGLRIDPAAGVATIAVGGRTDVRLMLRSAIQIRDGSRLRGAVTEIRLAADEPGRFVDAVRARLT